MLTLEEKARMKTPLRQTRNAILEDGHRFSLRELIEVTCDANRPQTFANMSDEDYRRLMDEYHDKDTQRWLREIL